MSGTEQLEPIVPEARGGWRAAAAAAVGAVAVLGVATAGLLAPPVAHAPAVQLTAVSRGETPAPTSAAPAPGQAAARTTPPPPPVTATAPPTATRAG